MKLTPTNIRLIRLSLSIAAQSEEELAYCWQEGTKERKAALRLKKRFEKLRLKLFKTKD